MEKKENNILEDYLNIEVEIIVEELFTRLKNNNINIDLERKELNEKELNIYLSIYKDYEKELISLKNKVMSKFGYINNFDYIFAKTIENIVNKNKEL